MSLTKFKLISCPEFDSFFIKNTDTNKTIYSISMSFTHRSNIISITDIANGEFAKITLEPQDVVYLVNYLSKKIFDNIKESKKTTDFNIDNFLELFVSTVKEREKVKGTIKKSDIFRFETIRKLKHQGFLCNCVKGFYPETKFYLLPNGRIKDSRTNNKVLFEQEQKIWDFLFKNRERVGKEVTPTIYDYCAGNNINISINGMTEKAKIAYITDLRNGKYQIKINFQGQYKTLTQSFTKDELINRVIESR